MLSAPLLSLQPLSCWTRICPAFVNSVDPEEANWSDPALFVTKYVNLYQQPDQVIWLAEYEKWAWHLYSVWQGLTRCISSSDRADAPSYSSHCMSYIWKYSAVFVNGHVSTTTALCITKTYTYKILIPLTHFYIVKLGFTGVCIIILISAQNIDCAYSLKLPRRGSSNEYPKSMFWAEIWKISEFLSENFHFFVVKFSIYLNRPVFAMLLPKSLFCYNVLNRNIGTP